MTQAKKIKVGVLAEELKKETKDLLVILKNLDIPAKTAASSIDKEAADIVREFVLSEVKPVVIKPSVAKELPEIKVANEVPVVVDQKQPNVSLPVLAQPAVPPVPVLPPKVKITVLSDGIVLKDFAEMLRLKSSDIIKELMMKGVFVTLNQKISADIAKELGLKFNYDVEIDVPAPKAQKGLESEILEEDLDKLQVRPPVVTIMGHVDHGKTKLLDAIRSTKVAESEAGGITQHIGAYQVKIKNRKITFLDTPGHEAFTALRARGAKITDIAVLVVAADDGVMPQTIEAIDHARAAGVPIIVAINKIDKVDANLDRVKQQLSEMGLQPEDWGGTTVTVPISAREKTGIDDLLEMILLVADMQEIKANPLGQAVGIVIESKLEKGRGPVASVLIKKGTIKVGDSFVVGATSGRVRALVSYDGKRLKEALPSTPVEIIGTSEVPVPGDILQVMDSEKEAKVVAERNRDKTKSTAARHHHTLEDFSNEVKEGEQADLNLIVKADVEGSLEALSASLKEINVSGRRVKIIHGAVGNIAESDVLLAEASEAFVIAFNVEVAPRAREISEAEGIEIKKYNIIYKLLDDVKSAMEGLLKPEYEEVKVGTAEVRETFKYSKVGVIAGCFVKSGKMVRGHGLRLSRDGEKIYEGKVESLKRFKEDVKEVGEGYECGIAVVGYENFKAGDIIETFEVREKTRK
ncbi:hypothetical protein A3J90_05895 [candidate division WOR-1 bacterium RIFOXYC2_FULL_37_10]|uniref:Translation initiation factor IF-2 n=1 Tax=candidate division WOR-1 bacterium RIFOXYB2_FULL_37_13 TaxID=1802579 RepID=A0A1F4SQ10_UNCSA|nr:MAG: hypothetical protein A2246_05625 [candidate division WOR-1 bacterium RIFOXYA2_FULL_37_7]OGC22532.1 MAG: hypothetical protein A2310_07170 [candidate division WOR-1 bacterium RIFOXYB2_FULL_37_13]OGC34917.1 MAG: hypothetical protein A3J90_05895 [candidate division WOR-1 bacterium RIFOXYC2_FULL_37_10]